MRRKGFTLLELIVVIIIISILAAVALPQYQKSVARARSAEGVNMLAFLRNAQFRYYQSHGVFTRSLSDLDIDSEVNGRYYQQKQPSWSVGCLSGEYTLGAVTAKQAVEGALFSLYITADGQIYCQNSDGSTDKCNKYLGYPQCEQN